MRPIALIATAALAAGLVLAGCTDESPQLRIASAKEYLQKKDTKAAVIEIKNALQKDPDFGEARYLLGTVLLQDGNAVAAEVEFRKALVAGYPGDLVIPELARSMMLLGQAKKVIEEFGATRLGKPAADASLQTTLAGAYVAAAKPEQAQAALAAALAADPEYAPALLLGARNKAIARDFDGAVAVTQAVISREPGNTDAWKLKGDLLLYAKKDPEEALVAYRKALQVDSRFAPGHAAILNVLFQQGKLDEAAAQLDQLKRFAAKHPQTQYFEAQLAYQRKDFKLARDLSQQLLQLAPNNLQVLRLAGAAELQLGSFAQAEIYLSKALQVAPDNALARRMLITAYMRSGQSAKAVSTMNAIAGKDGIEPAMYSLAGEVYLQSGDPKRAEEYFARALRLDPGNAGKRTALAVTHLASGQSAAAFDELQDIAASDKGTTADLALISAHLRRKEFDRALLAVDGLEAKQPGNPAAANLRGRIQLAKKDIVAARKSFEEALKIDPAYFAAAASLAVLDVADKKPEDAKKRFENMIALNPKNGQALQALAELAAASGAGKDEVVALLTKAVEANPTEAAPRLLLIDLYLRGKDNKQALGVAQRGVAALPNNPLVLSALGRVQQLSGDLNQAVSTYTKLVAMQPLSPQSHVRLAEAQLANKDNHAADQSLRKALDIQPDLLEAQRGLILLDLGAKKYQDAITLARTVQRQRPKEPVGYLLEGDVNGAQRNWDGAAAAYRAGLERVQSSELAIKLHAVTLQSGKVGQADQFALSWMKAHPKDLAFLSYLGDAALSRREFAVAENRYLAAMQVRPDNAVLLNNLAWVTHQLRKDGALGYAEKANQLVPNQPAFMDTLAMLLSAKGEHAKAVELQVRAFELQPTNVALRLNLARIYIAAGDKPRARIELDALVKSGEKYPSHPDAMALLKTLD